MRAGRVARVPLLWLAHVEQERAAADPLGCLFRADLLDVGHGRRRYRDGVGFNPFRQQKRRTSDYVLVGAALLVVLLLVLWAALPR
jgi:hypothetical protein